jgi:hypothetical protein
VEKTGRVEERQEKDRKPENQAYSRRVITLLVLSVHLKLVVVVGRIQFPHIYVLIPGACNHF